MKVYFSGSHSTGKSTLARYVASKYNLITISEVARMVLSEQELQIDTLRSDLEVANKYQNQIFIRQLAEERKFTSFVSDRSAIDSLAYSAQHTRILPQLIQSPELQTYLSTLKDTKSFIFFVRPSKATLKSDGVRETINWDAIIAVDAQIKLLYEMFNIRYFQINTDSMQERLKLIDSVLSLRGNVIY